jgi:hypothetical protein
MPGSCHLQTERSSLLPGSVYLTVSRPGGESIDEDVIVSGIGVLQAF